MAKSPTSLSIIVPVFNGASTLNRAVSSVLESDVFQTGECDLVIVDDGSTDETPEICKGYVGLPQVSVIRQDNGGASSARNAGLRASTGTFIAFVDADDYVGPRFHSEALAAAAKDNSCELVIMGMTTVKSDSVSRSVPRRAAQEKSEFLAAFNNFARSGLLNSQCNKLYRADVLTSGSVKFDERLKNAEDLNFNLDFIRATSGTIRCVETTDYFYVRHSGSSTKLMAAQYDPNLELDVNLLQRKALEQKLKSLGLSVPAITEYFDNLNTAWFGKLVRNLSAPGTPHTRREQIRRVRRIMAHEPERSSIKFNKHRSKLATLNRTLLRLNSASLTRSILRRI